MVGSQSGQVVLLFPDVGPRRFERFLLSIASGKHPETHLLVTDQVGLEHGQLLPEGNDFIPTLQSRGGSLAGAPAGDDARRVDQFAMLRGEGSRGIASAQLRRVIEIGGQCDAVEHAADQAMKVVALASDAVGRPSEGTFGRRTRLGEVIAVRCDHAGAPEFVLIERFEDLAGGGLVRDDNRVAARTERRFDRRKKPGFNPEKAAEHAADRRLEVVGTVESAQNRLRSGRRALAFEIELLENFETGLDLREVALGRRHFLFDALTLEFASLDFRFGAIERRLGRVETFGRRGDLSRGLFQTFAGSRLGFKNLATLVLEGLDTALRCFATGL